MEGPGALLIADLEGVAGVDTVAALLAGTPEHGPARALLTAEVNAAVEGLLAAGFAWVRVSDSHHSGEGASSLLPEALHPAARPVFLEDAYAPALFADVQAVACVGMHAAAGTRGFHAHTVDVLGAWTCAGQPLSEAELVLALAAEAGVPAVFVSGDDVLQAALAGRVGFVRTKHAHSPTHATSRAPPAVLRELQRAAAGPRRPVTPPPDAPLVLAFKSGHQAALAARTGARRVDRHRVEVHGPTFRERYTRARRATAAASTALAGALALFPAPPDFPRDAHALLQLPGPPLHPPRPRSREAERALDAFLALTREPDDVSRALRALTLHMLEGHAPAAFARWALAPVLEEALRALAAVPLALPPGLPPEVGMSRVDAWYLLRERARPAGLLDPRGLRVYLEDLDARDHGLHAWLLGEMAAAVGLDVRLEHGPRLPSRPWELYWLTHLFLLDTRYLRRPLSAPARDVWTEALLVAAPWVVDHGLTDLAAEVAFCLQCGAEGAGGAHEALVALLSAHQRPGGDLGDAHATAAGLLAFAGTGEHIPTPVG